MIIAYKSSSQNTCLKGSNLDVVRSKMSVYNSINFLVYLTWFPMLPVAVNLSFSSNSCSMFSV